MWIIHSALATGLVGTLVSLAAPAKTPATSEKATRLVSLENSLLPLTVHFNMHDDQPRLVAIFSPT